MARILRSTYLILESTDPSEYIALSVDNKALYQLIISAGRVDISDGTLVKTILYNIFGNESVTITNINNLIPEPSLAEEP